MDREPGPLSPTPASHSLRPDQIGKGTTSSGVYHDTHKRHKMRKSTVKSCQQSLSSIWEKVISIFTSFSCPNSSTFFNLRHPIIISMILMHRWPSYPVKSRNQVWWHRNVCRHPVYVFWSCQPSRSNPLSDPMEFSILNPLRLENRFLRSILPVQSDEVIWQAYPFGSASHQGRGSIGPHHRA